ncbi:hypothetical protein AtNW77_Chr2g0225991 [Arabidopsis thaliana]
MSSPVMNQDMIQEVLSYLPASKNGKFRLLNKECNKRSYESWFLNLNFYRTNSISGYFLESYKGGYTIDTSFVHERRDLENKGVSIDFLPQGERKIKACDASHGILLCVNDTGLIPEYIVCKPTTKQYHIIPTPKLCSRDKSLGITVTGLEPFRFPELVRYEGKLGVILHWINKDQEDVHGLWVLKSSCGKAWIKVKDIKSIGLGQIVWTPSNDDVMLSSWDRYLATQGSKRSRLLKEGHTNNNILQVGIVQVGIVQVCRLQICLQEVCFCLYEQLYFRLQLC